VHSRHLEASRTGEVHMADLVDIALLVTVQAAAETLGLAVCAA
jgi:hypothetical protein